MQLGDGVGLSWSVEGGSAAGAEEEDNAVLKMKVDLPITYRWLLVGFHNIPSRGKSWEDMALISIMYKYNGKQVSYLKVQISSLIELLF